MKLVFIYAQASRKCWTFTKLDAAGYFICYRHRCLAI